MLPNVADTSMQHDYIRELIEAYRDRPCLWKLKSTDYRNQDVRQKAYEEILDVAVNKYGVQTNIDEIKRKLNSLRTSYRRELKNSRRCNNSHRQRHNETAGGSSVYVPMLWYYHLFDFLKEQTLNETEEQTSDHENEPENDQSRLLHEDNDDDSTPNGCYGSNNYTVGMASKRVDSINGKRFGHEECETMTTFSNCNRNKHIMLNSNKYKRIKRNENGGGGGGGSSSGGEVYSTSNSNHYNAISSSRYSTKNNHNNNNYYNQGTNNDVYQSSKHNSNANIIKNDYYYDDESDEAFGKSVSAELKAMGRVQRIIAKKVVAEVLFHGRLNMLQTSSTFTMVDTHCTVLSPNDVIYPE